MTWFECRINNRPCADDTYILTGLFFIGFATRVIFNNPFFTINELITNQCL